MPALGPAHLHVAERDARTIVCAHSMERLKRLVVDQRHAVDSDLAAMWRDVDGGVFTLAVNEKSIETPDGAPKEEGRRLLYEIGSSADIFGFGHDVDEASGQVGVRVRMACEDQADADRVDKATNALAAHLISSLHTIAMAAEVDPPVATQQDANPPDMSPQAAGMFATLLESCRKRGGPKNAKGKFEVVGFDTAPIPLRDAIANLSNDGGEPTMQR